MQIQTTCRLECCTFATSVQRVKIVVCYQTCEPPYRVAVKALLIGIPLYIVMRIAARQAARERYEAMQLAQLSRPAGRLVFRFRNADSSPTLVRQGVV